MLDEESERLTKKEVECCNLQARAIIVLARCDFVAASLTTSQICTVWAGRGETAGLPHLTSSSLMSLVMSAS